VDDFLDNCFGQLFWQFVLQLFWQFLWILFEQFLDSFWTAFLDSFFGQFFWTVFLESFLDNLTIFWAIFFGCFGIGNLLTFQSCCNSVSFIIEVAWILLLSYIHNINHLPQNLLENWFSKTSFFVLIWTKAKKNFFLGIQLFLFFKIESWNCQVQFKIEFRETLQNFNSIRQLIKKDENKNSLNKLNELKFFEVSRI
jgi:hypothetical protein